MPLVEIVAGSESDLQTVKDSGMLDVLDQVLVNLTSPWRVSVISAHRNDAELTIFCKAAISNDTRVFIGIAGMAAALPGAISSKVNAKIAEDFGIHTRISATVIGVALASSDMPNGMDALLSMTRMPPGIPVLCAGIGKAGCKNAAIAACYILDQLVGTELRSFLQKQSGKKPAKIDIMASSILTPRGKE